MSQSYLQRPHHTAAGARCDFLNVMLSTSSTTVTNECFVAAHGRALHVHMKPILAVVRQSISICKLQDAKEYAIRCSLCNNKKYCCNYWSRIRMWQNKRLGWRIVLISTDCWAEDKRKPCSDEVLIVRPIANAMLVKSANIF